MYFYLFIITPKLGNLEAATEEKNATKWLHIIHLTGLDPFLSNRFKKIRSPQGTHVHVFHYNAQIR